MTSLNSKLQLAMLKRKKSRNPLEKGFTLIELLITVVILGTLSSVAVPGFIAQKNRADIAAANAQGKALMSACKVGVSEGQMLQATLQAQKPLSSNWTPTVTQAANAAPTAVAQSPQVPTEQSFELDVATGNMIRSRGIRQLKNSNKRKDQLNPPAMKTIAGPLPTQSDAEKEKYNKPQSQAGFKTN